MTSFFTELKRRHVFKVAAAYVVTGWVVAQAAEFLLESFAAPQWILQTLIILLLLGFPIALVLAWAFELTPAGLELDKAPAEDPVPVAVESPAAVPPESLPCVPSSILTRPRKRPT